MRAVDRVVVVERALSCRAVPACRTCTPGSASASSVPVIGSPERTAPGYPPEAMTTVTAASSRHRSGGRVPSVPVAEASSTAASGVSSRASTTCVSGSPKRALNSTTFSPDDVSASPT